MQQFKAGDHVIVDEGSSIWHDLETGIDGIVVAPEFGYTRTFPRVQSRSRTLYGYDTQYVDPAALIKVDDLVTYPDFKPGDRAVVVGNSSYADGGCRHAITLGTDVEVVAAARMVGDRVLCEVRGAHKLGGRCIVQSVAPRDLEPEPTYSRRSWWVDYIPVDYTADRTIEFALTPAAGWVLDEHGSTDRAVALREAVEVLGSDTDIDELIDAAEWLLTGKVPA